MNNNHIPYSVLQAIINHKFDSAISGGKFVPNEDSLTSSVFGLMQYLPDELFWHILRGACGQSSKDLPESVGAVNDFMFWKSFNTTGKSVIPDVCMETELYDIIIEVKRTDKRTNYPQNPVQWRKEIASFSKSYEEGQEKEIIFIAIGGNKSLMDSSVAIGGKEFVVHTASWYNFFDCVMAELKRDTGYSASTRRLMLDIIRSLEVHHFSRAVWLESLLPGNIHNQEDVMLFDIWCFDNYLELAKMESYHITKNIDLDLVWEIVE